MLVEIRCDAFRIHGKDGEIRPPIRFHEGLNTILGGAGLSTTALVEILTPRWT